MMEDTKPTLKEFNLSEKMKWDMDELERDEAGHIHTEDVKEFIRLLKQSIFSPICDSTIKSPHQIEKELLKEIDKLAGDKLK